MKTKIAIAVAFLIGVSVGVGCFLLIEGSPAIASNNLKRPCKWPSNLDAVVAASKNHKILMENDHVRVLDVTVGPGDREPLHAHCLPSVLVVIQGGRARDYDATGRLMDEGSIIPQGSTAPFAFWLDETPPHSVQNIDKIPIHLIRVELKEDGF